MGKYTKKGKVTEIPQSGIRTRARSLALQPNPELSYLQLRNRRLEKPTFHPKQKADPINFQLRVDSVDEEQKVEGCFGHFEEERGLHSAQSSNNYSDFDETERSTSDSTCSFIRNSGPIVTPRSTTRPSRSSSGSQRARNSQMGAIPTTAEMEEFFVGFELNQQKLFLERYNYDIMKDSPLPGRYEWVRVDN